MTREPPMKDSGRPDVDDDIEADLIKALRGMIINFQPFTMKPIGEDGSRARVEQDEQIKAHRFATKTLDRAMGNPDT